jgi:chemotaxis methyl-accepting protein methylase
MSNIVPSGTGLSTAPLPPLNDDSCGKIFWQSPALNGFNAAFCVNVFFYFNTGVKIKFVEDIFRAMSSQGYFFTGHAETLHNISKNFRLMDVNGIPVYKKD